MKNNQTAVDFLEESIHLHCLINNKEDVMIDYNTLDKLFMKAKAMEKEQIKDAFINYFYNDDLPLNDKRALHRIAEQYYNETYGRT